MKLAPQQLTNTLQKKLGAIYWVHGDETLLTQEACDQIRSAAHTQGFTDRQLFHVDSGFNWETLQFAANSLSLFSQKELLEVRLNNLKMTEAGKSTLENYASNPPADKILLIRTSKLSAAVQNSKYFKALDKAGFNVQIWPITRQYLPGWIKQRLQKQELTTDTDGIQVLVDRSEGNLLFAAQAVEKLYLLHGKGQLSAEQIAHAIADSARFNVFDLVDATLQGNKRALRIIIGLQQEGSEPTLVLWALCRELRGLANMRASMDQGQSAANAMQTYKVWDKRKPLTQQALSRHNTAQLQTLLVKASHVDRMIKGAAKGNVWDELQRMTLRLAGLA